MEKYWITLFPETFLWLKNDDGFIYNSKNFLSFHFKLDSYVRIKEICVELLITDNLYTASLRNSDIECDKVKKWINSVIGIHAGYLTSSLEKKPVSLKPILKLLNDVDYYTWDHFRGAGGNIIQNLHELTFYINNSGWGNNSYFKQTIFPIKNCAELEPKKIISFIRNSKNLFLSNINLVGNIFTYRNYQELLLDDIPITIHLTMHDFENHIQQITETQWPDNIRFNILFYSKCNFSLEDFQSVNTSLSITVIVTSEVEYNLFFEIFEGYHIHNDATIIPIYNGKNIDFFKAHVFADQNEFSTISLTKRDIFMRQTLNISHFGKLIILPDNHVYANVNELPLGTIDNSPYSLVYKELTEGKSWLKIREDLPCRDCIYQWLCPSPSNYETIIGRHNLCNFKI